MEEVKGAAASPSPLTLLQELTRIHRDVVANELESLHWLSRRFLKQSVAPPGSAGAGQEHHAGPPPPQQQQQQQLLLCPAPQCSGDDESECSVKPPVGKRRRRDGVVRDCVSYQPPPDEAELKLVGLLDDQGGLAGLKDVETFMALIIKAATVDKRALYLSVLQATRHSGCLSHFVEAGGLQVLRLWIKDAADNGRTELVLLCLQAVKELPVTEGAVLSSEIGKTIKRLKKGAGSWRKEWMPDTETSLLVDEIVEKWTERVERQREEHLRWRSGRIAGGDTGPVNDWKEEIRLGYSASDKGGDTSGSEAGGADYMSRRTLRLRSRHREPHGDVLGDLLRGSSAKTAPPAPPMSRPSGSAPPFLHVGDAPQVSQSRGRGRGGWIDKGEMGGEVGDQVLQEVGSISGSMSGSISGGSTSLGERGGSSKNIRWDRDPPQPQGATLTEVKLASLGDEGGEVGAGYNWAAGRAYGRSKDHDYDGGMYAPPYASVDGVCSSPGQTAVSTSSADTDQDSVGSSLPHPPSPSPYCNPALSPSAAHYYNYIEAGSPGVTALAGGASRAVSANSFVFASYPPPSLASQRDKEIASNGSENPNSLENGSSGWHGTGGTTVMIASPPAAVGGDIGGTGWESSGSTSSLGALPTIESFSSAFDRSVRKKARSTKHISWADREGGILRQIRLFKVEEIAPEVELLEESTGSESPSAGGGGGSEAWQDLARREREQEREMLKKEKEEAARARADELELQRLALQRMAPTRGWHRPRAVDVPRWRAPGVQISRTNETAVQIRRTQQVEARHYQNAANVPFTPQELEACDTVSGNTALIIPLDPVSQAVVRPVWAQQGLARQEIVSSTPVKVVKASGSEPKRSPTVTPAVLQAIMSGRHMLVPGATSGDPEERERSKRKQARTSRRK
jgi:hypothetical protein